MLYYFVSQQPFKNRIMWMWFYPRTIDHYCSNKRSKKGKAQHSSWLVRLCFFGFRTTCIDVQPHEKTGQKPIFPKNKTSSCWFCFYQLNILFRDFSVEVCRKSQIVRENMNSQQSEYPNLELCYFVSKKFINLWYTIYLQFLNFVFY